MYRFPFEPIERVVQLTTSPWWWIGMKRDQLYRGAIPTPWTPHTREISSGSNPLPLRYRLCGPLKGWRPEGIIRRPLDSKPSGTILGPLGR